MGLIRCRALDRGPRQPANDWLGGLLRGIIVVPLACALGGSNAEPQDSAGLRLIHRK
ncbi:hypothetical protein ACFV98_42455 [Streptomyces violascens]|uniref:hypothetical protein n=1 Tax=Streptomyces violascens TaxID=67381 RepID=UPI003669C873